tara:strand:+ start:399 stop:1082 length:684 start_codon:yes stop_codon:yes gene_type:complete
MIVSIHQPQYLPWLPYFSKINKSDVFVFLDNVQFQKNGLQNRNELKNSSGRFWLTIPISVKLGDRIRNVEIVNDGWSGKHVKSIRINYSKASYYSFFEDKLMTIYDKEWTNLADLNIEIIKTICQNYFEIETKLMKQSDLATTESGSSLILQICQKLKADTYVSGPSGKKYLDENEFMDHGINIDYMSNDLLPVYPQLYKNAGFINNISALDFILNVGSDWSKYHQL